MNSIVPQVSEAMQTVLIPMADNIAITTGMVKRQRKLTGSKFVQTLVFGWIANPDASLEELSQTAALLGVNITPQGLDERFTPQAAECLKQVLENGVAQFIAAEPTTIPLLQHFNGVYLQDSTTISLPDELAEVWTGGGSNHSHPNKAAIKVQVRWEMSRGAITHLGLQAGRNHDKSSLLQKEVLPQGALRLADLGYFSLSVLKELAAEGVYWLTRLQARCVVFDKEGRRWDLAKLLKAQHSHKVDIPIFIGIEEGIPCRLLAVKVPPEIANERRRKIRREARRRGQAVSKARLKLADWTILVSNAPLELLTLEEAMVLLRLRWQIELLFKLWKSHGKVDDWRSENPWRILTEVYAKLLAMLVQHWVMLVGCWRNIARSIRKAAQTIQKHAVNLAIALASGCEGRLFEALHILQRCMDVGCRINKRKTKPHTYQLLLAVNG